MAWTRISRGAAEDAAHLISNSLACIGYQSVFCRLFFYEAQRTVGKEVPTSISMGISVIMGQRAVVSVFLACLHGHFEPHVPR